MEYQLHLNLQQRAALRIAIYFWERKEVQDKVTEFFKCCSKFKTHEIRYEWRKLTKTVVDEWNKELLPRNLNVELIHIIKMLSETILNWFQYIKHEYGAEEEAINCVDKIHWTPYGTVDTIKIFKSFWLNNPNIDITKLYHFACSNILEEHIDDLWHKMPQDIQINGFLDVYARFNRHILAYWKGCRDNDLHNLPRYFEETARDFNRQYRIVFDLIYDSDRSLEENMLRLSIHQGYFVAVKYFWEKITKEERDESVLKCARIAVMRYHCYDYDEERFHQTVEEHNRSQYIEILIFLMNRMTKGHRKALFNEKLVIDVLDPSYMNNVDVKDDILAMLLSTWPWQKLFIPVLKDMLQYQDDNSTMYCFFLDLITREIFDDDLNYCVETGKYQSLLREAWIIVPASIKQKIVHYNNHYNFINHLISAWDLNSLKLIFNDPAVTTVRDELIQFGSHSFGDLIFFDQFERLDQLMEEILRSEEEKRQFKQKIDVLHDLVLGNEFDLADKMLDWQCSTPEERQSVKSSMNHIGICEEIIRMSYEDAYYDFLNYFLNWKFDTEEEKRNCKNHFRSDEFFIKRVFTIWNMNSNNVKKAKKESSLFLNWLLESNEEITHFKKRIFLNFDIHQLMRLFIGLYNDGNMADFLIWSLSDNEDV